MAATRSRNIPAALVVSRSVSQRQFPANDSPSHTDYSVAVSVSQRRFPANHGHTSPARSARSGEPQRCFPANHSCLELDPTKPTKMDPL